MRKYYKFLRDYYPFYYRYKDLAFLYFCIYYWILEKKKEEGGVMRIFIDSSKDSLVTKVHLNIDSTCIEISDLSSVSSVSVVEKEGEVFIDSVTKEAPVVEDSIIEKVEPISDTDNSIKENKVTGEDILKNSNVSTENIESLDEELFKKLADLRRELASKQGVPPYYIFHDKSLKEMAISLPSDFEEMKIIKGVGDSKVQNYGVLFLDAIQKHLAENG